MEKTEKDIKVKFGKFLATIEKINYQALSDKYYCDPNELKLIKVDKSKIITANEENIVIGINRNVKVDPDSIITINVEAKLILFFDEDTKKLFIENKEFVINRIRDKKEEIINQSGIMNTVSSIVSNVSMSARIEPIITIPIYKE